MSAAPRNPVLDHPLSNPVTRFSVLTRDGDFFDGNTFEENPDYRFTSVTLGSGGGRLDAAEFQIIQKDKGLQDAHTPAEFQRAAEIRVPHETTEEKDAGVPEPVLFRGEFGICSHDMTDDGREVLKAKARAEQWYFGGPITGYKVALYEPGEGFEYRTIEDAIVFNPEIDELIRPNRSDHYQLIDDVDTDLIQDTDKPKRYVWIHPDSVRTENANIQQGQHESEWSLHEAVMSLCWLLNPGQERVKNPDYFQAKTTLTTWQQVLNVEIPRGLYLPQALDLLLNPFGFSWFVQHELAVIPSVDSPEYEIESRIVIYKRGEGPEKEIKLQAWGEDKDTAKTNHAASAIEWNICDLANIVTVYGAFLEVEGTFELYRAWSEADDELTADQLAKGKVRDLEEGEEEDEVEETLYEKHRRTWRDWVLNEAGDYNGTRTTVRPITEAFDVNTIQSEPGVYPLGQNNIFRRRRFLQPLTKETPATRRQVLVEYFEPPDDPYTGSGKWKNVLSETGTHFELLEHECGIRFTGAKPPEKLMALGEDLRIRITACIRGDQRIKYETSRAPLSPNGADIRIVSDASTQFFKRTRLGADAPAYQSRYTESAYMSEFPLADATDNTAQIEAYANALRANEYPARLSVTVKLEGFHPEYKRGDLITKIAGREISFDQHAKEATTRKYPQVSAITYTETATELTLETFEDTAARGLLRAMGVRRW